MALNRHLLNVGNCDRHLAIVLVAARRNIDFLACKEHVDVLDHPTSFLRVFPGLLDVGSLVEIIGIYLLLLIFLILHL